MVRTSHVQLKLCINDLKILKFTLKEAIISCSHIADVSENQSQLSLYYWLNHNTN